MSETLPPWMQAALEEGCEYLKATQPERMPWRQTDYRCPVCGNHGPSPDAVDHARLCRRALVQKVVETIERAREAA